ncbi:MAG: YhcH/YjgK/YiaL family protein [Bacteroidaceae bacterium]|nr:YhcH/YjgK/YiaL family protein [Bacteroidaceae bacterium]
MILAKLSDSARYESIHPALSALFEYVKTHHLLTAPTGRLSLDDENLFINVVDATLMTKDAQKLEVHRAYIDVHIPLSGSEIIGVRHIDTLDEPDSPFDESNDCAVYTAPATNYVVVEPGDFLLVFPEDAHAPVIGSGKLRKLIAKVRIEP